MKMSPAQALDESYRADYVLRGRYRVSQYTGIGVLQGPSVQQEQIDRQLPTYTLTT